jgi:hypothetical protein
MNIKENTPSMSHDKLKINFIFNAIENGWSVRKDGELYFFKKKHNNDKMYFKKSYVNDFVNSNI